MNDTDRWGDRNDRRDEESLGGTSFPWLGLLGLLLLLLLGGGGMFIFRMRHARQVEAMHAARMEAEAAYQQIAALERQVQAHDQMKDRFFPQHDDARRLGNALIMDLQDSQVILLDDVESQTVVLAGNLWKLSESEFVIVAPLGIHVIVQTDYDKVARPANDPALAVVRGAIVTVDHAGRKITIKAAADDCRFEKSE